MDRTTRTIIVVGVAVLVAGIASFGVYRAIQQMPVREIEVRSLYEVVAAHDMPMGTLITPNDVKVIPWPASSPVANGFTSVDGVVNRGLVAGVVANEPITESKLAPKAAGAGLPPSITEGMRALSIRVTANSSSPDNRNPKKAILCLETRAAAYPATRDPNPPNSKGNVANPAACTALR